MNEAPFQPLFTQLLRQRAAVAALGLAGLFQIIAALLHIPLMTCPVPALFGLPCPGPLVTFIYGWVKSGEWGIRNIMLAWTAAVVLSMIFGYSSGFGGFGAGMTTTP